jgi:hypothetical protein
MTSPMIENLLDDMDLKKAICLIEQFPPLQVPKWIQLEPEQEKILNNIKFHHWGKAQLLKHMMLSEPHPGADFDQFFWTARCDQELFNLIINTRLALRKSHKVWHDINPATTWSMCILTDSFWMARSSGLESLLETGVATPSITDKTSYLAHQTDCFKSYDIDHTPKSELVEFDYLVDPSQKEAAFKTNLRGWIEGQAFQLAQELPKFRRTTYESYWTVQREANNAFRQDDTWQLAYLMPDGSRFETGKHSKIPLGFDSEVRTTQKAKRGLKHKKKLLQEINNLER